MEDFEEYCPGGNKLDSDDKDGFIYTPREVPVFDIDRMFNLEPALKANPQYDDLSVLSFFTNTTTYNACNDDEESISTHESNTNDSLNAKTSNMEITDTDTSNDAEMASSEQQIGVNNENE